jgi:hypothetical protein
MQGVQELSGGRLRCSLDHRLFVAVVNETGRSKASVSDVWRGKLGAARVDVGGARTASRYGHCVSRSSIMAPMKP